MEEYKRAFYNLRRVVKEAKRRYRDKVESQFQQSDKLDHFYAHFKVNSTSANPQAHTAQVIAITVSEHDLRRAFKRVNTWKAAGPESNSRSVPMACTDQLAQLFTTIFILCPRSLTQPAWMTTAQWHSSLWSWSALSICFLLLSTVDSFQFAYQSNRSTDDAIIYFLQKADTHLDNRKGNYVKMLFIDYSSAFNTIIIWSGIINN